MGTAPRVLEPASATIVLTLVVATVGRMTLQPRSNHPLS